MANVDEHFWLFYNLSTNTFQRLEVSRGKYPIIKYRHFFASLNKLSKWEKNCVCTNNGRLVIYEGNNAIIVIRPWTLFGFGLPFLVFRGIIDRHFSIIRLVAAKIAEHFLMSAEIFLWTLKSVCRFLHSLIKKLCFVHQKSVCRPNQAIWLVDGFIQWTYESWQCAARTW